MIAADAPRPADTAPAATSTAAPRIVSIDITHLVRAALAAEAD